jgi:hypothetical protein
MIELAKGPDRRRQELFRETSRKMAVHEAIIEKDFWVCLILRIIFSSERWGDKVVFKGGTSLSKAFGAIERFSEDIDLILDWRLLGYTDEEPWAARSANQQDLFGRAANQKAAEFLSEEEVVTYMQIVGSLIWISGVRHDINYGLMYLTWFTKKPRVHHMSMAYYMVSYLYHSKDVPLVLGGTDDIVLDGYCDSSWGTGPKGRSICAVLMKLSARSACIVAKATASLTSVRMSSFESELETCTLALKTFRRIVNIIDEMGFEYVGKPRLHNDNEAMINFVKGEGVAKGIQHVELRMWYIREQYAMGNVELVHMSGKVLPADRMTKPSTREEFEEYRYFALGLGLL